MIYIYIYTDRQHISYDWNWESCQQLCGCIMSKVCDTNYMNQTSDWLLSTFMPDETCSWSISRNAQATIEAVRRSTPGPAVQRFHWCRALHRSLQAWCPSWHRY